MTVANTSTRLSMALAALAMCWLLVILIPQIRQMSGVFLPAMIGLGGLLFAVGGAQILISISRPRARYRRLLFLNGGSAMCIPLAVLGHNLMSGLRVEEPGLFLLAVLGLPLIVVATSVLIAFRSRKEKKSG